MWGRPSPHHQTWTAGVGRPSQRASHPNTAGGAAYPAPNRPHSQPQSQSRPHSQPKSAPPSRAISPSSDGIPEPPSSFPELETMSVKDLRLLRDEKAKFDDFVSKHKHQTVVDEVVARIRADVENFEREHEAITAKMEEVVDESRLIELQNKIAETEEEVQALQKMKDEWMENNSPERLIERLKIAIAESEAVSEGLEKSMLSSSMNFDEFLTQYIACRRKYHERSLKLEQLKQETRKRSLGR